MKTRFVCLLLIAGCYSLPAQDQPKPADQAPPPPAPADQTAAATPAPTPAPTGDENFTGDIEFGWRIIPNISGSFNTYRSVVDLGEGPKLFGANATILDPNGHWFDRIDLHVTSIGDDPYETAKFEISRRKLYRLTVDWRNLAYFNYLPSYANPFASSGSMLDANSFDTRIQNTDIRLELLPGTRIVPYLEYGRNSQNGVGITSFVASENNYAVATQYKDRTDSYRGGVDFNFSKLHVNIEEGGTTFRDDQAASNSVPSTGDFTGTFLGQQLLLNSLYEIYGIRGDSTYSKVSFGATPVSWATISGQFVYAKPRVNVNYFEQSSGNFYYTELAEFYNTGQDIITGTANMPHPSANLNFDIRPWKRIRIVDFWMTDRTHDAGSDLLSETLLFPNVTLTPQTAAASRLAENYSQNEIDGYLDLTSQVTIRVGERYVWGDATLTAPSILGSPYETNNLRQNVGIFGVSYRLRQKTRINADYEVSSSNEAYFRTSLRNFSKFHVRASHDITSSLRLGVDYSLLTNSDPDPSINYSYASHAGSVSLNWLPKGGKWFTALLDYTRSSVQSSILYLVPQTFTPDTSLYHENAHTGTALIGVKWFTAGGSFFVSSGSRPIQFYEPLARVSVPVYKHIYWNAEWRYYGFADTFYQYQGFRSNQLMTSLRLVR
jgi:hypothetical protein